MTPENNIEQKIRQIIEKLTKDPIDTIEFKRRFEKETGWRYIFDSFPKLLKEEPKDKWIYETKECIDTVYIDVTTNVSIHAVELWAMDYKKGDM
ncbi:MAG: hypothetical protein JHC26_07530, partial [Thermofilum sp.]|uniref:hypothetical protein n=1 Tax=Thermofilum sp. TaxID=1961369 RepID=UPI002589543E